MQHFMMTNLLEMYPNLNRVQVETFVLKLFNTCGEWAQFKPTLRDLLISMKQFASLNDALYSEERDEQIRKEQEKRLAVPGLARSNN